MIIFTHICFSSKLSHNYIFYFQFVTTVLIKREEHCQEETNPDSLFDGFLSRTSSVLAEPSKRNNEATGEQNICHFNQALL